jgi:superfamily II DNA/RNA helicase
MEHIYFEVGTSLLAKPQALCDLVELEAGKSILVFCNSPSDADFADVILKKRGVSSLKLIGYVPQIKLSKAIQGVEKKEVTALVLTDVAARGVPLEHFDIVINYSLPVDPEVYFTRYVAEGETKTAKVLSLVAAVDISNFHFLNKLGKAQLVKGDLPSPEQIFINKFASLRDQAVEKALLSDAGLSQLADKVLADGNAKDIVALLLHNTLSVIPSLKAAPPAREEREEDYEDRDGEFAGEEGESQDFGRRDDRGRGRDRRDSRGGRRDRGESRGNRDDRGGRPRSESQFDENDELIDDNSQARFLGGGAVGGDDRPRRGRGRERDRDRGRDRGDGERGERGERQPRQPRPQVVVDKEARLYVGSGSEQGVSKEAFMQKVVDTCGISASDIHRVAVRGAYTFVDVPEAIADQVVEGLSGSTDTQGKNFFVKKAVTLSIPREGAAPVEGSEASFGEGAGDFDGGSSNGSMESHEGPTMLAVDEQN